MKSPATWNAHFLTVVFNILDLGTSAVEDLIHQNNSVRGGSNNWLGTEIISVHSLLQCGQGGEL